MKTHVHRGRGGRLLDRLRRRFQRKSLNPDLLREDLLRSLKARFDEASRDLQACPAGEWERKIALQKSLAYLAQVLISAARAYEEWGHTYEGEEPDVISEKLKERVDAIRELAAQLPEGEGKGKAASAPIESEEGSATAAEEDRQSGTK